MQAFDFVAVGNVNLNKGVPGQSEERHRAPLKKLFYFLACRNVILYAGGLARELAKADSESPPLLWPCHGVCRPRTVEVAWHTRALA